MSWELASFLILGGVLLAGFAWYERSRPPSQVVALVAALAALAIAGRIAFAAFPNVKPTTDIVILAGYALGPAPGFAVGGLTALVSNLWFGQGPWTPWQMAGWGLCGIYGAILALSRRPIGRCKLAAACGLAGVAYGALLNFSLMATYGGELSMQRFLALESRALPFDLAHAVGNVVFALVAGPAMLRMLVRFRERFEWRARTPALVGSLLVALLVVTALPTQAQGATGAAGAADWLVSVQNSDGGWGSSPGSSSSASITSWAMLGLEATGRNPLDISKAGSTPVDFLRSTLGEIESSGDYARTILALEGAGVDAHSFAGRDLVSTLANRRGSNGSWEGWPATTAYAVLALRAAGDTGGLDKSLSWLGDTQNDDGGWGDERGKPSTADNTGAAMQALRSSKLSQRGLSFLKAAQLSSGGFAAERRRPRQFPVDGVGGPGDARDRNRSRLDHQRRQVGGQLPARAPGLRRPFQLLLVEQSDPGLGHRPGAAGRRRHVVPDLADTAPRAEAEARPDQLRRRLIDADRPDDTRGAVDPGSADPALGR